MTMAATEYPPFSAAAFTARSQRSCMSALRVVVKSPPRSSAPYACIAQSQKYGALNGRGARQRVGLTDRAPSRCSSVIIPSATMRPST